MRRQALLGTALIILGGAILLRGLSVPADRADDVSDTFLLDEGPIARLAAAVAVIGGLVLVLAGRRNA
jgi:hypothetical protein